MSEPAARRPSAPARADDWVDKLMPVDVDWRALVERYPLPCVAVAAIAGYLLGRSRGAALVGAVAVFAGEAVEANVQRLLDRA